MGLQLKKRGHILCQEKKLVLSYQIRFYASYRHRVLKSQDFGY